jgi:UDP-N-acetylglucosamine:LPS N-acetylglucosamine transferase
VNASGSSVSYSAEPDADPDKDGEQVRRRFVILSAGMGAGHQAVAGEIAGRLAGQGHDTETVDVLALLPAGLGAALRRSYAAAVRYAPWLYEAVYRAFFVPRRYPLMGTSPLAQLAAAELRGALEAARPDTVVSTFHLAAQMCGRLRAHGALGVPSVVVVTDFAAHRQWFHPGNDVHLCPTGETADALRRMGAREALAVGPVVPAAFFRAAEEQGGEGNRYAREFSRRAPGASPVLVSSGAWGVGSRLERTAAQLAAGGCLPVVLCGRNEALRRRLARRPGVVALGWVEDLPEVMAAARVLVENAAGQTAAQALAAGLPVVSYRPIAGHGVDGARHLAAANLAGYAADPRKLVREVEELAQDGSLRRARTTAGKSLFTADAAAVAAEAAGAPSKPAAGARDI